MRDQCRHGALFGIEIIGLALEDTNTTKLVKNGQGW